MLMKIMEMMTFFSKDQNKSAFGEDETASYINVEEVELSINNFVDNETNSVNHLLQD